jgi:hypothetical protein
VTTFFNFKCHSVELHYSSSRSSTIQAELCIIITSALYNNSQLQTCINRIMRSPAAAGSCRVSRLSPLSHRCIIITRINTIIEVLYYTSTVHTVCIHSTAWKCPHYSTLHYCYTPVVHQHCSDCCQSTHSATTAVTHTVYNYNTGMLLCY